jgi:intein/homing endonuclease
MGKLRNSAVGESEANLYRALRIVESVSPCVTEETEVTLADGTSKPIGILWQESLSGLTDLSVQCWNERKLNLSSTQVRAITRRQAEAFRVDAANGYYLNATEKHQHYIMRGGLPEWATTSELIPGDMLAVATAVYPGNPDCSRFHPSGMRTYQSDSGMEFRRGGGGFRDAVIPKLPEFWTPELGWILGVIEGDGFIGSNDGIGLVNTSERILSAFEQGLINQFELQAKRQENNRKDPSLSGLSEDPTFKPCWTSLVTNQLAAEFLREARKNILTAPPTVRASFLAGWVDADGCIGPNKISLTVKHPKMWLQRQLLARQLVQSLGVVPSKFDPPSMEITGSRAVSLAGIIGTFLIEKGSKAIQVSSSGIGFDRGSGFACGQLLHEARKSSGIKFSDLGISSGITWSYESGRVPISERHLNNYIEKLGSSGSELKRILEADCRWVRINSIESIGVQDVYDLVCEGEDTHSFIANGLVTHNCIMWIDEAEKSLSGGDSSAQSDAGTTSRLLGILSTWTQESNAPACLVMTANSLKTMPAEMVNRMPERFFFDIPDEETLIDIIKIHARAFSQDVSNFDLATLAEKADGLVGREIEQAVEASMVKSFNAKKPGLDYQILLEDLTRRPRIIKTMSDEIRNIIDWVGFDKEAGDGVRARFASKGRSTQFKSLAVAGETK